MQNSTVKKMATPLIPSSTSPPEDRRETEREGKARELGDMGVGQSDEYQPIGLGFEPPMPKIYLGASLRKLIDEVFKIKSKYPRSSLWINAVTK